MSGQIEIRPKGFVAECASRGISGYRQMGTAMHVSKSTTHRIVTGRRAPSARFIASAMIVLGPGCFGEIFKVVPADVR